MFCCTYLWGAKTFCDDSLDAVWANSSGSIAVLNIEKGSLKTFLLGNGVTVGDEFLYLAVQLKNKTRFRFKFCSNNLFCCFQPSSIKGRKSTSALSAALQDPSGAWIKPSMHFFDFCADLLIGEMIHVLTFFHWAASSESHVGNFLIASSYPETLAFHALCCVRSSRGSLAHSCSSSAILATQN